MKRNSDAEVSERLDLALRAAQQAGDVTLRYFRLDGLEIERKADLSPVTVADREAEQWLRVRIGEQFPDDGIVGEEFGTQNGSSGYQWVLDPIDGTKSFIHGVPLFTTLVAVLRDDRPCLGVIHAPAVAETVYAAVNGGCWHLRGRDHVPQPARVSSIDRLDRGLLLTTEIASFTKHRVPDAMDTFLRLQRAAGLTRTWGDGYGYLMVATGRAEVMIDPVVNLWDAAPLQTILEEAGGQLIDWRGNATIHSREAIATNGLVTEEVLAITRAG
jgi:histidinol phosphatase-like enzyme (inositol monophosphatase family)